LFGLGRRCSSRVSRTLLLMIVMVVALSWCLRAQAAQLVQQAQPNEPVSSSPYPWVSVAVAVVTAVGLIIVAWIKIWPLTRSSVTRNTLVETLLLELLEPEKREKLRRLLLDASEVGRMVDRSPRENIEISTEIFKQILDALTSSRQNQSTRPGKNEGHRFPDDATGG